MTAISNKTDKWPWTFEASLCVKLFISHMTRITKKQQYYYTDRLKLSYLFQIQYSIKLLLR